MSEKEAAAEGPNTRYQHGRRGQDINCNIAAKLTDGDFLYFQSITELQDKIRNS
eukprot:gene923-230_t